jgi:cbb3-type cytochrome oxidase subunit 3
MVIQPQYKRFAVLLGSVVLLVGVFIAVRYFVLNKKPKELTQEQKIEIINKLNQDAKNAPIVTIQTVLANNSLQKKKKQ